MKNRFNLTSALALAAWSLSLTNPLHAATVDFNFEPPEIEAKTVCPPRTNDQMVLAAWEDWEGTTLEGRTSADIKREIRRLRELDAAKWSGKIRQAIDLLPTIDSGFGADQARLELIETMIAAGKTREVEAQGLIADLLNRTTARSPRIQLALSRYLRQGIGVERDIETGFDLLKSAAMGGNADALLEIVGLQLDGESIDGWDVSPDLAVTMAFGALVGKLDPMICDRVTRIAREYKNGDIVTRNMVLSERWYRFAADLGDADAAWKVAELHMQSDELVKNNDTLITYLTLAADGGAPFALIALGRVYENGALVARDLDRARAFYDQAAATGDRAALVRLTQMLASHRADGPKWQAAYDSALQRLAARPDAPAWAYLARAEAILSDKGRWAGEAEAMALLERGAASNDGQSIVHLAEMRMRHTRTPQSFYAEIDKMIHSVTALGMNDPAADLYDAFMCRAPAAPQVDEAAIWQEVEASKDSRTVSYTLVELQNLALNPDPLQIATLQTQALYGRATALAQYLTWLELTQAPASQLDFWTTYGQRFDKVSQSRGRLLLDGGAKGEERARAIALLRDAVAMGDVSAGLPLANALLHPEGGVEPDAETRAEALTLLDPIARAGVGEALELLPLAAPARWPDASTVARDFATEIEARGDFHALVFAMPHLDSDIRRKDYLNRAATVTNCSFEQVIKLADTLGQIGDADGFTRWTTIARALVGDDGWQITMLGDKFRLYGTPAQMAEAVSLYETAYAAGNRTAAQRLLAVASDQDGRSYDAAKAASLYVGLLNDATPDELVKLVRRIEDEEAEIRDLAFAQVSPAAIYEEAAIAGNPVAMREFARILKAKATSPAEVGSALTWMKRAAELGDAPAMLDYAEMLAFGIGGPASREDALIWLQKAAAKGVPEAAVLYQALNLSVNQ